MPCKIRLLRYSTVTASTLLCVLIMGSLAGCQSIPSAKPDKNLYQALGGREGISRIDTRLLLNIAADPRISKYFQDTDIDRLHRMLTNYICVRVGGPCNYTGDNMIDAHRGLGIDSAAFNALVEDLIKAMNQEQVPIGTQNRLLALLAPTHSEIVGKHPLASPEIMHLILGNDPIYQYIAPEI